jgi:hypothetical protein
MPQTIGTLGLQQNPAAEIDALGPVGWWRLNDTSGSTAVAKVGLNATYLNSPSLASGSLAIDGDSFTANPGSTQFVSVNNQTNINGSRTAFTVMAFVRVTNLPGSSATMVVWENGGQANGIFFGFRDISGVANLEGAATNTFPTFVSRIRHDGSFQTGKTYHIAYGYDSATPSTVLYIDGTSVGTVVNNTGGAVGAGGVVPGTANAIGGVIGNARDGGGNALSANTAIFDGRIGDVAFFDYLLTESQVRRIARQMMTT